MGALFDKLKDMQIVNQKAFSDALRSTAAELRLLSDFTLELTPICNFSCKMCYARISADEVAAQGREVLTFDEWRYYIDGFTALGAMTCTLTGGECTIHPDFCKIYKYAYSKGLTITVMTNGSGITDEIVDMFRQMPPDKILITIYGASEKMYERMCANAPAYKKVMRNIDRLLEAKMTVIAQFTSSNENFSDMEDVFHYTLEKGLEFRYSNLLMSFDRCSKDTLALNQVSYDKFDIIHRRIWCEQNGKTPEYIEQHRDKVYHALAVEAGNVKKIEKGVPCNAGRSSCYINWKGEMTPCVSLDAFAKDPHESGLESCWKELVAWADEVPRITECQGCIHRTRCKSCIALHYSDTGEFGKPSPRICFKQLHPEEAAEIEAKYLGTKA